MRILGKYYAAIILKLYFSKCIQMTGKMHTIITLCMINE